MKREKLLSLWETASLLNEYFSSVFTKERMDKIPEPSRRIKEEKLKLDEIQFTKEEVIKQLEKLQVDKIPGVDKIHPKLLHETRAEIGEALANLFKKSFNSGELPRDWKDAVVVPLFKKGCKDSPGNYKSVSLTSITCKVMERMIKESMSNFFERNKVMGKSRHGFTRNRSCLTNLLEFFEEVCDWVDKEKSVDVAYLDLEC